MMHRWGTASDGPSATKVKELRRIIERRVRMGYMPHDRASLLERRGDIETAATDLASFVEGYTVQECQAALEEMYP